MDYVMNRRITALIVYYTNTLIITFIRHIDLLQQLRGAGKAFKSML